MKYARQKELMEIIQSNGYLNAAEAAKRFDVSIATIRRDLKQLEHQGLLEKNTAVPSYHQVHRLTCCLSPSGKVILAAVKLL